MSDNGNVFTSRESTPWTPTSTGFDAHCSTLNVAGKLKNLDASAIKKRQFHATVSLDIQNAFGSMLWTRILEAIVNAKAQVYLHNIIWDYFRDQVVFAQTALGSVRKEMTCNVPQGSVLGPLLWNITYNNILKEEVPPMIPSWLRQRTIGVVVRWKADLQGGHQADSSQKWMGRCEHKPTYVEPRGAERG